MKKITAIILGTLVATSAVFAQSNVLSRNAVGYIKIPVGTNKLHLVSNPFVPLDAAGDLVTNMFAAVANNTTISIWNEVGQGYVSYLKNARGGWSGAGFATARVARADGVFIRSGGTGTVYFMGEVPDRFTAPTTTQSRASGITMLGFPYPVEVDLTNSTIGLQLSPNSTISFWVPDANAYTSYLKNARGAWVGAAGVKIKPGDGMVIRSTNAPQNWNVAKSYTWP